MTIHIPGYHWRQEKRNRLRPTIKYLIQHVVLVYIFIKTPYACT